MLKRNKSSQLKASTKNLMDNNNEDLNVVDDRESPMTPSNLSKKVKFSI
jgi:hypothetical protein